ncbi:MAG: GTP-binding protein [Candidatus Thorarchaeota archaeon]|nr:MAG: GTP-binding protein [Candidatus Thorarchaeota archaeon]
MTLIVPGTTVSVTLSPGFVEIRDKGIVKKKILTKNKSFETVLEEVESYFNYIGRRLAPGLLKDVMIRIGVPQVKLIVDEKEPVSIKKEEPKPKEPKASPRVPSEPKVEKPPALAQPEAKPEIKATLEDQELLDIESALSVVESLSDSFMTPADIGNGIPAAPPEIRIDVKGAEEIAASVGTRPTVPEVSAVATKDDVADAETITPAETAVEDAPLGSFDPVQALEEATPAHVVKPLVDQKAIILGEENVGKASLIKGATLGSILTEDLSSPYIHDRVFELTNHRVKLHVWSFDEASQLKVPRAEFYSDTGVVIIVYSAADRWSFQSIDFWLKEALVTLDAVPPLVIVGNKSDLRDAATPGQQPVSKDEGFKLAEELAKSHGGNGKLHPVAFIETSCETGEGVEDVFKTAAELSLRSRPPAE